MNKRSYDFLGFAGGFVVLAAVVAVWVMSQSKVTPTSANAPQDTTSTSAAQPGADNVVAPRVGDMGQTKVQPVLTSIAWENSYEAALERGTREGKPVLVDFYTDWCGYCKKLDAEVYTDKTVVAESARFVCVKVNAEHRPDLAKAYGVTGFPYIAFVRSSNKGNTLVKDLPGFCFANDFVTTMQEARSNYQRTGAQSA